MFTALARFSVRYRWPIIVAWLVAVPLAVKFLPSLSSVAQSNNAKFLPSNSPSMEALKLAAPFQGQNLTATSVIVIARSGGAPLTPADNTAMTAVEQAAGKVPGVSLVRDQGTSKDGQARTALVAISSGNNAVGQPAQTLVDRVRAIFATHASPGRAFHLTGQLAQAVDSNKAFSSTQGKTQLYSIIFIIILLLIVFRSVVVPFLTLIPVGLSLALAGPVIAEVSKAGVQVSQITQILLIVLLLGAGTDYGLFLVFRVREELRAGAAPKPAVINAMGRVGESITFSAATVVAALLSLMLATFAMYSGLGPGLAIALAIMLLSALTLLPALLTVFGHAAFWPFRVQAGDATAGLYGRIARRVVRHPGLTLAIGVVLFAGLATGIAGFKTAGFTDNGPPAGSDSALGNALIAAHFPEANNNPETLFLTFAKPVWSNLAVVEQAQKELQQSPLLKAVSGAFDPNGSVLTAAQLTKLRSELGPAAALPATPPPGSPVSPAIYQAYRATTQFISPNGMAVQFYAVQSAGITGSSAAMQAIPRVRAELTRVAASTNAQASGVGGQDALAYDVSSLSNHDLKVIIPIVLLVIGGLLGIMLRSLVSPIYLIATVGLSYLASLGLSMIVFVHIGGQPGLNFVLPFLMFVFSMALGEDYNILVMSRIREEAHDDVSLAEAVSRAVGVTGGTVTSAGVILAGTFAVLGFSGTGQIRQIGLGIAAGVLLDTFFVRTLLVPSIVVLLGKWNWWPSHLYTVHDARETRTAAALASAPAAEPPED
ncbi:MAG: MMPL family transporter [Thermoleophilia bacterium]